MHTMKSNNRIHVHQEGKIDIHRRQEQYLRAKEKIESDTVMNSENRKLILTFLRDCQLGKTIRGKAKKKIGYARCLKYLGILRRLSDWFGKSFESLTQPDMERLIERLESDQVRSTLGRPYSDATKCDIKMTIRKFWKWKDGDNRNYPELVEWIDTSLVEKDIPALTRAEVDNMIDYCNNPRDKALLMVLFDSGARVEELLNVRLKPEHLFWKEVTDCYMMRLEFSKTKPRTISLPLSTSLLNKWLEVHPAKDNPHAQLFPLTYGNLRMLIHRIGKRVLAKRVSPHILRHSSATYYANRLKSPYKLCYRYGWTMASNMVNRYLDREGILEEETAEVVRTDEISKAHQENSTLKEELSHMKEAHSDLAEQFQKLQSQLQALESGKGVLSLLASLAQKTGSQEMPERIVQGFDVVLSRESLTPESNSELSTDC